MANGNYSYRRQDMAQDQIEWEGWTFYLMGFGVALVGGLIGAFLSWVAILGGIVALIAIKFWNTNEKNKTLVMVLGAALLAGGIASLMFGAANSLTGDEMAQSSSLRVSVLSTPQKITDFLLNTFSTKPALPDSVVNSIIAQGLGTTSGTSAQSTGSASLTY